MVSEAIGEAGQHVLLTTVFLPCAAACVRSTLQTKGILDKPLGPESQL